MINPDLIESLRKASANSIAKISGQQYLPLWTHMIDSYGVIAHLWDHWLSFSLKQKLTAMAGSEEDARALCCYCASIHDIGKHTSKFQQMIISQTEINIEHPYSSLFIPVKSHDLHHSRMGQEILSYIGLPIFISSIIGGHHGDFLGKPGKNGESLSENPRAYYGKLDGKEETDLLWENDWKQINTLLMGLTDFNKSLLSLKPNIDDLVVISGLVIMADWIASNTDYFPLFSDPQQENEWSESRISEGCSRINLPPAWHSRETILNAEDFSARFHFHPNPMQEKVIETANSLKEPGLLIIEAEMGTGKTEAALAAANIFAEKFGQGGLYFGLPTQATANGIFPRILDWADQETSEASLSVKLAHSKAGLNSDYQELISSNSVVINKDEGVSNRLVVNEWMSGRKRALLSDFVIGTIDQLIMMGANSKHAALRHLGAAGKVVILDELHSFDSYTSEFIDRTLSWLGAYQVPVILLSATLASGRRKEMLSAYALGRMRIQQFGTDHSPIFSEQENNGYPRITWFDGEKIHSDSVNQETTKKVSFEFLDDDSEESILHILKESLSHGGSAGIIANYVSLSQSLYEKAKDAFPEAEVVLFHSRFTDEDRARIESEVLDLVGKKSTRSSKDKVIIIGTQVIEQSLDIDFDVMITQKAPIDLIFQRIGRLHRHQFRPRPKKLQTPKFYIFDLEETAQSKIYESYILSQTVQCLAQKAGELYLPYDIPRLVETVYGPWPTQTSSSETSVQYSNWKHDFYKGKTKADSFLLKLPEKGRNISLHMLRKSGLSETKRSESLVRDIQSTLHVLIFKKIGNGNVETVSSSGEMFKLDQTPDPTQIPKILNQRISLPLSLTAGDNYEKVENEVIKIRDRFFSEWTKQASLSSELFVLLDSDNCFQLNGMRLRYSKDSGLLLERDE
ncbi:MAG: CRISPR-associated helicase Cas3' [Erysipelotrichaceae bacterium]|nr:CRISPR-associated helicase Cas3' [Erysipelotrichaceae bacterium]